MIETRKGNTGIYIRLLDLDILKKLVPDSEMRYFFGSLRSRKERQCHYVLHRPFSTKNFVFIFCNPLASHTSNQSPRFSNSLIRLTLFELLLYIAHWQCLISAFNVSSYLAFRERSRDVPRFCTLSDQILSVPH